jgi:hypothetical protein
LRHRSSYNSCTTKLRNKKQRRKSRLNKLQSNCKKIRIIHAKRVLISEKRKAKQQNPKKRRIKQSKKSKAKSSSKSN